MSLFLLPLLTACASPLGTSLPAASLLLDCPVPKLKEGSVTNKDIADLALALRYSLNDCNADKAALRAWADGTAKGTHP